MRKTISYTYDRLAVGERIRQKRLLLGLSQDELSELIDRVPKYCADIERGSCGMSIETMIALSKAMDMPLDYLMFGKIAEEDEKTQHDEVLMILNQLNDCPDEMRDYAVQLLRLFLAACGSR